MQLVKIYPDNPNRRAIQQIAEALRNGNIIIYPTDTLYAIGCDALNVRAVERICRIKGIDPSKAALSIVCQDLSDAAHYARIDNRCFHLYTPGRVGATQALQTTQKRRRACARQQHSPCDCRGVGQPIAIDLGGYQSRRA